MPEYCVDFDRVSRNHDVPSATFVAEDSFDLAEQIYDHVRPMVMSSVLEVIAPEEGVGTLLVGGFRNAGNFTVARIEADGAPCCPDPSCPGNPCTFPGYADNH